MMTPMQPISKASLVRTGPSPEFVELCKTLYGDVVDPHEVWIDVIKLSPDQADVSARGQAPKKTLGARLANGAALVGTGAGSVLGVSELAHSTKAVAKPGGRLVRLASKVPEVPGGPKAKLALAGTMLGADVLATNELRPKKQQPTGVEKISPKTIPIPTAGATRRIASSAFKDAPKPLTDDEKTARRWHAAGSDIGEMLSTTSGKVVTGTLVGTGGLKAKHTLQRQQEYYKRDATADVEFAGTFSKFDDDKRLAFGWASVVKVNGAPVVDRQGDYIDLDDLEEAAYNYVHKSRVGGDMHKRNGEQAHKVSDMVESMMFTDDKIAKMGLPDDFPRGWWVGYKIHDEDTWSEVRKGGRTGFSIHGKGLRKDHALDEIMGY